MTTLITAAKETSAKSAKKAKREHAQCRNLKNFYFDDVTKNKGF